MAHDKTKMRDCGYAGQILDFVYDELTASAKTAFEGHLSMCSSCTADVADLSSSRLAVREWRAEAFEPLATPKFVVAAASQPAVSVVTSILAFFRQPLYAASAATLLIAAAAGIYFLANGGRLAPQVERAVVNAPAASEKQPATPLPAVEPSEQRTQTDVEAPVVAAKQDLPQTVRRPRPQVAKQVRPIRNQNDRSQDHAVASNGTAVKPIPEDLFGEVSETRDRSLRLTDLFAEGDED